MERYGLEISRLGAGTEPVGKGLGEEEEEDGRSWRDVGTLSPCPQPLEQGRAGGGPGSRGAARSCSQPREPGTAPGDERCRAPCRRRLTAVTAPAGASLARGQPRPCPHPNGTRQRGWSGPWALGMSIPGLLGPGGSSVLTTLPP